MKNFKVIDNFLKQDHFEKLRDLQLEYNGPKTATVYRNIIDNNGGTDLSCLSENLIKTFYDEYTSIGLQILKELSPKKVELFDYSEFSIIETGKDYSFPIHRDIPTKLLSGVIYLTPQKNNGTYIYENKNGKNKKVIEWKQNRAFFFSRSEESSWHSYEGDKISNRIVLVYNMMTKDLKRVCEIENINFYKVKLREKINPILYRYFKFTIK